MGPRIFVAKFVLNLERTQMLINKNYLMSIKCNICSSKKKRIDWKMPKTAKKQSYVSTQMFNENVNVWEKSMPQTIDSTSLECYFLH